MGNFFITGSTRTLKFVQLHTLKNQKFDESKIVGEAKIWLMTSRNGSVANASLIRNNALRADCLTYQSRGRIVDFIVRPWMDLQSKPCPYSNSLAKQRGRTFFDEGLGCDMIWYFDFPFWMHLVPRVTLAIREISLRRVGVIRVPLTEHNMLSLLTNSNDLHYITSSYPLLASQKFWGTK